MATLVLPDVVEIPSHKHPEAALSHNTRYLVITTRVGKGKKMLRRHTSPFNASVELPILFTARSLSELEHVQVPNIALRPGTPFQFEIILKMPFARFLAKRSIFERYIPQGLELVSVERPTESVIVVNTRVRQMGQASVLLPAIVRFLAANWVKISIIAAVGYVLLSSLISRITGRGLLPDIVKPVKAATGLALAVAVLLVAWGWASTRSQS